MSNQPDIIEKIKNPACIKADDLKLLDVYITHYPFFQTAHLLKLKALHNSNDPKYAMYLKIAASYATDRTKLYELIFKQPVSNVSLPVVKETEPKEAKPREAEPSTIKRETKKSAKSSRTYSEEKRAELKENISETLRWQLEEANKEHPSDLDIIPENNYQLDAPVTRYGIRRNKPSRAAGESDTLKKDIEEDVFELDLENDIPADGADAVYNIKSEKEISEKSTQNKDIPFSQMDLISKFLEQNPKISADPDAELKHEDISKQSVEENDGFITDTLAKIYVKQKLYTKAIFAYEKLILKYPEKRAYFASQIEDIKRIITDKT